MILSKLQLYIHINDQNQASQSLQKAWIKFYILLMANLIDLYITIKHKYIFEFQNRNLLLSIQIFKNFMEIEEEIYLPSDTNQPQEHQALDYAFCSNKLGIIANDELVILVTSTVVQEFANYVQGSQLKTDIESLSKAMNEDL